MWRVSKECLAARNLGHPYQIDHYRLHDFRGFDAHHRQHADQFAFDHGCGRQQELLPSLIGLGQDVVPVIEVVELLRQLEGMLGGEGRFGRRNALLDDVRSLARQQP